MQFKKRIWKIIPLIICFLLSACAPAPASVQLIDNKIEFDGLNLEKKLVYTVKPEKADKTAIKWISEDENIAYFTDSAVLHSKSAGETKVYAVVRGKKSNKLSVTVADKTSKTDAKQEKNKTEPQSTGANGLEDSPQSNTQTVYIGKTGTKYHRQTCSTLKGNGSAIPLSEALAQGREPCKRCNP